jgi:hypothetical protein
MTKFIEMPKEEQIQLWNVPNNRSNWETFSSVRKKLLIREVKSIPVRLIADHTSPMRQRLVKPFDNDGNQRTVGDILSFEFRLSVEDISAYVQGIEVPLEFSIYDTWKMLSYADFFVYIVARGRA